MSEENVIPINRGTPSHEPRPSKVGRTSCAICGRPIMFVKVPDAEGNLKSRCLHAPLEDAAFSAERQKKLFERLDAVADALRTPDLTMPDLIETLATIYAWRMSPQMWKTLDRWAAEHGEPRRVVR